MDGFRQGRFNVLVATDIAARGIDVSGISHVINYDVPATVEAYTHRIGRTGRADHTGEAFTFATGEDNKIIKMIEKTLDGKMDLAKTVTGSRASESNEQGKASGTQKSQRPARKGPTKKPSSFKASEQSTFEGKQARKSGGARPDRKAEQSHSKGNKVRHRRRRRSAPLGVDFFTNPRRTGPKTGKKAA